MLHSALSLVIIASVTASMLKLSAHLVCCRTSCSGAGFKATEQKKSGDSNMSLARVSGN